jgi:hypothetical protein
MEVEPDAGSDGARVLNFSPNRAVSASDRPRRRAMGCSIRTFASPSDMASAASRCADWREAPSFAAI